MTQQHIFVLTSEASLFIQGPRHQIRVSDILSWDRKSYLNHVILPRLAREGCTLVVLEHYRQVMSLV